jgi:hypothetical protein
MNDLLCSPLQLSHQWPGTLNKLQYFVHWDLMVVTWIQQVSSKVMAPEFCKGLVIAQNVKGSFIGV